MERTYSFFVVPVTSILLFGLPTTRMKHFFARHGAVTVMGQSWIGKHGIGATAGEPTNT